MQNGNEMVGQHRETPVSDLLIGKNLKYLDLSVESFEVKKDVGDSKVLSGYVSTKSPDLYNDIVEPSAFEKYLYRYKNNPIYCYNHEQDLPIGRVNSVQITEEGLYLDDIKLSSFPFVDEFIWPLVKDNVLKQQSIGFYSLDGEFNKDYYVHKEIYLLECSLVPVAANPEAFLDSVKGLLDPDALGDERDFNSVINLAKKLTMRGQPLSRGRKTYSMNVNKNSKNEEVESPLNGIFATDVKSGFKISNPDTEGVTVVGKPSRLHKDYDEICSAIHALVKYVDDKPSYILQFANYMSDGTISYDWEKSAVAMFYLLGGRNDMQIEAVEKACALERLNEAYLAFDKEFPIYKGVHLDCLSEEALDEINVSNVEFCSEEKSLFEAHVFKNNLKEIQNFFASKKGESDEVLNKYVGMFLELYIYPDSEEEMTLASRIMELFEESQKPSEDEDMEQEEGAYAEEKASEEAEVEVDVKSVLQRLLKQYEEEVELQELVEDLKKFLS